VAKTYDITTNDYSLVIQILGSRRFRETLSLHCRFKWLFLVFL